MASKWSLVTGKRLNYSGNSTQDC
jgi:hypothetical protein